MYVNNFHDGHVKVEYIPAHTNHTLGQDELKHLPLPISTKEEVAMKLSLGVPPTRILNGKCINAIHTAKYTLVYVHYIFGDFFFGYFNYLASEQKLYGFLPQ